VSVGGLQEIGRGTNYLLKHLDFGLAIGDVKFQGSGRSNCIMATQKETVEFILGKLRHADRFSARAMFGEYALYADGKVVALICDDRLYVKILPASQKLEALCEKGEPYPGAKPHYVVDEGQLSTLDTLAAILFAIAKAAPAKKKSGRKK
jgi:TfoX/Sxy family transcriptional regulator of competence genes